MKTNVLVNDKKYEGKYVAFADFADKTVIAAASTADRAIEEAKKSGHDDPVIMYIPEKDLTCIF